MNRKNLTLALFLGTFVPLTVGPVHAQNLPVAAVQDNAEQRINFSGRLRMLSQRIPSAACHLNQGVDVEGAKGLLSASTAEFEKILTALELGDADINIQEPEKNARTLSNIATLRARWEPLKLAAEAIMNDTATAEDHAYVLNENLQVLAAAQLLVEQLVRQYSNPNAMTFSSLMLIDISGRQRMLTQKMSKESCMIAGGTSAESLKDDLTVTTQIFENSLDALRNGMEAVGIAPPPNAEIAAGLDGVAQDWERVKPHLTEVLIGGDLNEDERMQKFQGLNQTMVNMNIVVGMYANAAHRMVPLN